MVRVVCCGYLNSAKEHILCSDPIQKEMYLNPTPDDSHGTCDACFEKEVEVINEWLKARKNHGS